VQFVECLGTEVGVKDEYASQLHRRIPFYREQFENCTTVKRNLEIVHVYPDSESDLDMSFFENIREVRGYVLVVRNFVGRVRLTSLRVIRGRRLFRGAYSLFVTDNSFNSTTGLRDLELPSLMGQ